jgi:hypothetical protein
MWSASKRNFREPQQIVPATDEGFLNRALKTVHSFATIVGVDLATEQDRHLLHGFTLVQVKNAVKDNGDSE